MRFGKFERTIILPENSKGQDQIIIVNRSDSTIRVKYTEEMPKIQDHPDTALLDEMAGIVGACVSSPAMKAYAEENYKALQLILKKYKEARKPDVSSI